MSFFLSLCFSPSVGGVQVRNSTIELFGRFRRRYKQHKVLAKQSLASVAPGLTAEVAMAPVEEWIEIALKI